MQSVSVLVAGQSGRAHVGGTSLHCCAIRVNLRLHPHRRHPVEKPERLPPAALTRARCDGGVDARAVGRGRRHDHRAATAIGLGSDRLAGATALVEGVRLLWLAHSDAAAQQHRHVRHPGMAVRAEAKVDAQREFGELSAAVPTANAAVRPLSPQQLCERELLGVAQQSGAALRRAGVGACEAVRKRVQERPVCGAAPQPARVEKMGHLAQPPAPPGSGERARPKAHRLRRPLRRAVALLRHGHFQHAAQPAAEVAQGVRQRASRRAIANLLVAMGAGGANRGDGRDGR